MDTAVANEPRAGVCSHQSMCIPPQADPLLSTSFEDTPASRANRRSSTSSRAKRSAGRSRGRRMLLAGGRSSRPCREDTLMSTLTVHETVLYSALLRLPRDMSLVAKKFRTPETMNELGISGIKDPPLGVSDQRSISGGEKRRVSIACELVTSPSILFLDEPASGLDSYNAFDVVECLISLARDHNRTVTFTIHQPRSNIVALFHQLILLAALGRNFKTPGVLC
ncbi:P-loop containing nucleoside triphosphate hydrolase protein [Mycena haematopus]|nr:P-loop containing nucleoside triphosphate hydrolase protein [Mycena haematopus]